MPTLPIVIGTVFGFPVFCLIFIIQCRLLKLLKYFYSFGEILFWVYGFLGFADLALLIPLC